MTIYDASVRYQAAGVPLLVIAGKETVPVRRATGQQRARSCWVKAVLAESFERIHRSNLVNMGVLPLEFKAGAGAALLKLTGTEEFNLLDVADGLKPRGDVRVVATACRWVAARIHGHGSTTRPKSWSPSATAASCRIVRQLVSKS